MGNWKGRGNQYIKFVRVLYCKLPTNGKQLPAFLLEAMREPNPGLRGGRTKVVKEIKLQVVTTTQDSVNVPITKCLKTNEK